MNQVVKVEKHEIVPYDPLRIVEGTIELTTRKQVQDVLPDLIGRALARAWIDPIFKERLQQDTKLTLEQEGVSIPATMHIEMTTNNMRRQQIVVYEQAPNSKFKMRVCYFALAMMAGR